MSVNLVEKTQKNLGYPELQKIDPNTQAPKNEPTHGSFAQAAIPAVLTGLYKYAQTEDGAETILTVRSTDTWIEKIFTNDKETVIRKIADYSKETQSGIEEKLNDIAGEAIKIAKENMAEGAGIKEVKTFFNQQKDNILLHLVPALNMGTLLHDDTLDDSTNKMEGPVSSLIKNIGAAFASPVTAEEIEQKKM